jgi:hypothetical protein
MVLRIKESQIDRVNELVERLCCNCDEGNCLLLDDGETHPCIQLISVTGIYCKYFKEAVLPADKKLYAEIINYNKSKNERKKQNEKLGQYNDHRH